MNDLTHLSLFTGIGGIDLAAEWAGFTTIGQVEQNPYALRVLRKRFGRIPRWSDIRDFSADDFRRRTSIDSPTLISGGFPCQPFSCAGKRRGKEDDRYLWPEMFRVVRELRPDWVLGENVAGIVNMELESCCSDLEGEGYRVRAFLIPACGVGALHRRERVFIVAHTGYNAGSAKPELQQDIPKESVTSSKGQLYPQIMANTNSSRESPGWKDRGTGWIWESYENVTHPYKQGFQEWNGGNDTPRSCASINGCDWWNTEPALGRVAHGGPHRVDRLRCLGNAVVPQQVYPILAGIAQVEKEIHRG